MNTCTAPQSFPVTATFDLLDTEKLLPIGELLWITTTEWDVAVVSFDFLTIMGYLEVVVSRINVEFQLGNI